ncbi:MAG: DNA-processing protein DprA [Bacteroidales bacterium]
MYYLGNIELLNKRLVGFLSSRETAQAIYPLATKWIQSLDIENDVIYSGAQSHLERFVVKEHLMRGGAAVCVLPRSIPSCVNLKLQNLLNSKKLLLVSPFSPNQKAIREHNAMTRNRLIIDTADTLFVGNLRENGSLQFLLMGKHWYDISSVMNEIENKECL